MKKKFEPAEDRRVSQKADNQGTVVIKVFLASHGHTPMKGNRVASIRLKDCKVSEVATAIRESLLKE